VKKTSLYRNWLKTFGEGIPAADIQKYVKATGNFLWHVFSWKLLKKEQYLSGDNARAAFDRADKSGGEYIIWFEQDETAPLPEEGFTAAALEELTEVYVVGRNFEWTYIKTHEGDFCGPYFMTKKGGNGA